jgi:GNAT superfamily N-acetyltransferase
MPAIKVSVSCPIRDSFRVQQVAGMFGLTLGECAKERFEVDVPGADEDWQIGLVVGPSGSGKSTIAGRAFGDRVYAGAAWPDRRAVVDCFDELSIRQVVELFTAVGFSSPPAWLKPYGVLSNGERFRCDLARALAKGLAAPGSAGGLKRHRGRSQKPLAEPGAVGVIDEAVVVFDEFTSVVDRTVAKVCSAAIAKGIRRGRIPCRFVAVTCHYDVADWLEPDWVVDMSTCELIRRTPGIAGGCFRNGFRRPAIKLEIHRCHMDAWQLFKRHHYMSGELPLGTRCYLATWDGEPVHFSATMPVIGRKNHRRFARIVTLPDFQGIGIGMRAVAGVAELHRAEGYRINVTSSHPALIRHCERSPLWRFVQIRKSGRPRRCAFLPKYRSAVGRVVVSFEYVGARDWGLGTREVGMVNTSSARARRITPP